MNRILLGVILGIVFGVIDVLLTLRHGQQSTTALLQAFSSRFALGFLGTNLVLPMHPVITGMLCWNFGQFAGCVWIEGVCWNYWFWDCLRCVGRSDCKSVGSIICLPLILHSSVSSCWSNSVINSRFPGSSGLHSHFFSF